MIINWKTKAFIQKYIARLPDAISYEIYFQMQRSLGALKKPFDPFEHFAAGVDMIKSIEKYGKISGKTFFEVGTGHVPLFPITFWLCGAGKIVTIDLNPYMRNEIILDLLFFVKTKEDETRKIFGELLNEERFNLLLHYSGRKKNLQQEILKLCQIEYIVPGDAAKTKLPEKCIDYHISHRVYEHIPLTVIYDILKEGNRIIAEDGLFVNLIDYKDHFAYMDSNISAINFLRFSDKEWSKYAGNRFTYLNRARHDDFVELFKSVGHEFLEVDPYIDKKVEEILENNELILDEQFRNKTKEILSIIESFFITKKIVDKTEN